MTQAGSAAFLTYLQVKNRRNAFLYLLKKNKTGRSVYQEIYLKTRKNISVKAKIFLTPLTANKTIPFFSVQSNTSYYLLSQKTLVAKISSQEYLHRFLHKKPV